MIRPSRCASPAVITRRRPTLKPSTVLKLNYTRDHLTRRLGYDRDLRTVTSPKTEHHDGHGSRLVPLFPELLPHLREAFEQAQDGAEYVITQYRPGANVGPHFTRIVKRAGLKPWPKLWQNLRATRATELAQQFPKHVATAWLGHSAKIAAAHYLQVTAEHFTAAAQPAEPEQTELIDNTSTKCDSRRDGTHSEFPGHNYAKPGFTVAQNPTQQAPARGRRSLESQRKTAPRRREPR